MTESAAGTDRSAATAVDRGPAPPETQGLRVENVTVRLGAVVALQQVTLALEPGWTVIVGPNGAGKSTLLRACAGLQPPDEGAVRLDGEPLGSWPARGRAQRIAWLAQQGDASGELTVREVVHLGRLPHLGLFQAPGPTDERIVEEAMRATACIAWQHRRLQALSGGERQRVLLARALAVQAPLLLLDEPTAHLDPPHQVALVRLLRQQAAAGVRVVSVLHDLTLALLADRLVLMREGRVLHTGSAREPALRQALIDVFEGAFRLVQVEGRWLVVPEV